jgi:hypothetical protein
VRDTSRGTVHLVVLLVGAALVLGACSGSSEESLPKPSKDFCEAAHSYEEKIQSKHPPSIDDQIVIVGRIAANAPADVKADAEAFLDAMRRVRNDPSVKDNDRVRKAVDNVNRRAGNGCDFFKSDPGSGM